MIIRCHCCSGWICLAGGAYLVITVATGLSMQSSPEECSLAGSKPSTIQNKQRARKTIPEPNANPKLQIVLDGNMLIHK
jgi:hypothetical protein